MDLIKVAEEAFATGKKFPEFRSGDTITVAYKIIEGSKERIQLYRGVVIKISGHGDKKRFTVRKMSGTVGVERIFPIESPNIDSIEVNKHGKVRLLFFMTEVDYLFFFDVMPPFFVNVMVDCCSLRDVWSKIRLGLNRRPLK
nr:50S ribosomal protein L19 [Prevotella sp.]